MKLIEKEKFIEILKTSIFDYCLTLPIIESNNTDKIECYVSEKSNLPPYAERCVFSINFKN